MRDLRATDALAQASRTSHHGEVMSSYEQSKGIRSTDLIEEFKVPLPSGGHWWGRLYGTQRRSGRRIVVVAQSGVGLFDTDDCHDAANARGKLDDWLNELLHGFTRAS